MMMLLQLLAVTSLALMPAAVHGYCCFPDSLSGGARVMDKDGQLSFDIRLDFKDGRIWGKPVNHSMGVDFVMTDVGLKREYTKMKDGSCIYQASSQSILPKCIPSGARDMGESFVGSHHALPVRGFNFQDKLSQVYLLVSKAHCVPLTSVVFNREGTSTTLYYDMSSAAHDQLNLNLDVTKCVEENVVG